MKQQLSIKIGNWDVSVVTDMNNMFFRAISFNQEISNWDVSNVIDMSFMFVGTDVFNQDLSNLNVSNVISHVYFDYDTNNWVLPKPIFL